MTDYDDQLASILHAVDRYLEGGTPDEALDRLLSLTDALAPLRSGLKAEVARAQRAEDAAARP